MKEYKVVESRKGDAEKIMTQELRYDVPVQSSEYLTFEYSFHL